MISYLELMGFQIHKSKSFVFTPGVNVVLAPSDGGKSSMIRALRWLTFNRPGGDSFINFDSESCAVRAGVDGKKVSRKKGKGVNQYRIDDKVFKALGSAVPEEVSRLLNLGEVNFQMQLDPLFWFLDTPGIVGKKLNSIVNLEVIDSSLQEANVRIKRIKTELEVCTSRGKSAQEELATLSWVEEADKDLKKLEALEDAIASKRARIESLSEVVSGLRQATETQRDASKRLLELAPLVVMAEKITGLSDRIDQLQELLGRLTLNEETTWYAKSQLEQKEKELATKFPNCPICKRPLGERKRS